MNLFKSLYDYFDASAFRGIVLGITISIIFAVIFYLENFLIVLSLLLAILIILVIGMLIGSYFVKRNSKNLEQSLNYTKGSFNTFLYEVIKAFRNKDSNEQQLKNVISNSHIETHMSSVLGLLIGAVSRFISIGALISVLGGMVSLAIFVVTYMQVERLDNQNSLLNKQNDKIDIQSNLLEAERRSSVHLLTDLYEKIGEEIKSQEKDSNLILSQPIISQIVSTSHYLRPYRYLEGDTLTSFVASPEKGQLFIYLTSLGLNSMMLSSIIKMSNFDNMLVENYNFDNLYLNNVQFDNLILNTVSFENSKLDHVSFENAKMNYFRIDNCSLNSSTISGTGIITFNDTRGDVRIVNSELDLIVFDYTKLDVTFWYNRIEKILCRNGYLKSSIRRDSIGLIEIHHAQVEIYDKYRENIEEMVEQGMICETAPKISVSNAIFIEDSEMLKLKNLDQSKLCNSILKLNLEEANDLISSNHMNYKFEKIDSVPSNFYVQGYCSNNYKSYQSDLNIDNREEQVKTIIDYFNTRRHLE